MKRELIAPYIENKLISEQAHPENSDLRIYNYTQKCQFDKAWDDVTRVCRGLILDVSSGKMVANPFPKFFNYGEQEIEIPKESPVITEKLDGSLGILYWQGGKPWIATRGSFVSDQALWATEWLRNNVQFKHFLPDFTYLFEIIYPENKIVVSYDFSGLVLLAVRHTDSGREVPSELDRFQGILRLPRTIPSSSLEELKNIDIKNEEGFVVFYPSSGLRLKIKFPEYVRLHRLVTGISAKAIWDSMRNGGKEIDAILNNVPDEFFAWVKGVTGEIERNYQAIEAQAKLDFEDVKSNCHFGEYVFQDRKQWALEIQRHNNPAILFRMLDDLPYAELIWKMVKPKVEAKTYAIDIET